MFTKKFWACSLVLPIAAGLVLYLLMRMCSTPVRVQNMSGNLKVVNNEIIYNDSISLYSFIPVDGGDYTFRCRDTQTSPVKDVRRSLESFCIGQTEIPYCLYGIVMYGGDVFVQNLKKEFEKQNNKKISESDLLKFYMVPVMTDKSGWNKFMSRLSELTGRQFRLPSMSEWYYAAQGGKKSRAYQYSGSNSVDDVAWYVENSEGISVGELDGIKIMNHRTCSKKANELGLFDMSGGVAEYVTIGPVDMAMKSPVVSMVGKGQSLMDRTIEVVGGALNSYKEACRTDLLRTDVVGVNPQQMQGLRLILCN